MHTRISFVNILGVLICCFLNASRHLLFSIFVSSLSRQDVTWHVAKSQDQAPQPRDEGQRPTTSRPSSTSTIIETPPSSPTAITVGHGTCILTVNFVPINRKANHFLVGVSERLLPQQSITLQTLHEGDLVFFPCILREAVTKGDCFQYRRCDWLARSQERGKGGSLCKIKDGERANACK